MQKLCIELRNERYFIAFETAPTKPISVLWSDLSFIRKHYGIERYNTELAHKTGNIGCVTSPITKESLNYGRLQNIADYNKAIELNIHYAELNNLMPDGSFGSFESKDEYGQKIIKQRVPNKLTKSMKAGYEREVAKGLYVVCKFEGELSVGLFTKPIKL